MSASTPPPPPLIQRWVNLVLAFGVSVAIGLAPLLGTVHVPGFAILLSLFPISPFDTTATVIPLSALLMGVVAVGVQFYSRARPSRHRLRASFKKAVFIIGTASALLLIVHTLSVEKVPLPRGDEEASVLIGFSRPDSCAKCEQSWSDLECLGKTTLRPAEILTCWSETQIDIAFLLMAFCYLTILCSFGFLVGLIAVQTP